MTDITAANVATYGSAWSIAEYSRSQALTPWEARLVSAHFPAPPARVLDLGCGAGRTTIALHRMGYRIVGIDLATALLDAARQLAPDVDVRTMDASALTFGDAEFDAALFSYNGLDCLYPLATRERCLREVRRVLKPGAPFVFSSHNFLGECFSGGFWYPRGYWNAGRLVWQQWGNPAWREDYVRYRDGSGEQLLHAAAPARTVEQLRRAGFSRVQVTDRLGTRSARAIRWHEAHVQFCAWSS
jgi:SAM-dependent methyltransferase